MLGRLWSCSKETLPAPEYGIVSVHPTALKSQSVGTVTLSVSEVLDYLSPQISSPTHPRGAHLLILVVIEIVKISGTRIKANAFSKIQLCQFIHCSLINFLIKTLQK
jgi:hypothetical protein